MNPIFTIYEIKEVSVENGSNAEYTTVNAMVECGKFFVESLAMEEIRIVLGLEKYNLTPRNFTIVKVYENTQGLQGLIIDTVAQCMKISGTTSLAKVIIVKSDLEKYLLRQEKGGKPFLPLPKIKVIVQPCRKGLVQSSFDPTVIKEPLQTLLGDQFEVAGVWQPLEGIEENSIIVTQK